MGWTFLGLAMLSLSGCLQTTGDVTSADHPSALDTLRNIDLQPRFPHDSTRAEYSGASAAPATYFGSPVEAAVRDLPAQDATGGYTLNFENASVGAVAQAVLGDILNVGYTIDPRAQGAISLSSGRPVAKKDVLFVLENALKASNLSLVRDPVGYRIVPATETTIGGVDQPNARGTVEPGYGLTVIPVQYVSGATLVKLMEGFATKPGMVRTDPSGRMLMVVGTGAERQAAADTVRNFDVDWLRGQSVGIYPVHNSSPDPIVAELEKIMDTRESGLGHDLVKFQSVVRQNSIMVVASKPELLRVAATWIARLDGSSTAATGVKVYKVKYGDAKQMADLLSKMFGGSGSGASDAASGRAAPGSGSTNLSNVDRLTGGSRAENPVGAARAGGADPAKSGETSAADPNSPYGALAAKFESDASAGPMPGVRITADVANNSVLVYANADNYRVIEHALVQLDRPKLQVAIEVTIAEVTLNDDLNYGVQFFMQNRYGSVGNSSGSSTAIAPSAPGFNLIVGNNATPQVVLSALHQYTDVKVLSNPSLVVVDNQVATLEVGDQVPVSTGSANVLSANNAVVNTIDYKNTGIILRVQPRVSSNGEVLLDVEQEISSVPPSTAGTNLTPTISERKVKSELSVASGQTVLLAGLISETQSITHSGVPVLDQIPVVGAAFTSKAKANTRTELILFIKPQIIRGGADASVVAEELRSKMRGGQLGSLGLPNLAAPAPHRNLQ